MIKFIAAAVSVIAAAVAVAASPAAGGGYGPVPSPGLTPVAGAGPTVGYRPWNPGDCATGEFGALDVLPGHSFLPVTVMACTPQNLALSWGVVAFHPGAAVATARAYDLRSYGPTGTDQETLDLLYDSRIAGEDVGLCLMRTPIDRLACVRVDITSDGATTATPIAVDDPLVSLPVVYDGKATLDPIDPYCATCLGDPD